MIVASDITTPRLRLRRPDPSDLPAYTAYYTGPRSKFVRGPYTKAECFDKFAAVLGHWEIRGFGRYTITLDDRPIGHAGPLSIDASKAPELTWTLWDDSCEGKGYATEASAAVRNHLLGECGWPLLEILIQPDNTPSLRVAERLNARRTDTPAPNWYPGALTFHLDARSVQ